VSLKDIIKVAIAVVTDAENRVLITQRSLKSTHGGFWEFPGGKLEAGEEPAAALQRELQEEVGLEPLNYHYLGEVCHEYPQRFVSLLVFHVNHFNGQAMCREAQLDLRWVAWDDLKAFQFPAANLEVIRLFQEKEQRALYN
jgi:8-oxo-dGTP diphosphatase